uniref:Uncharacterized protein n=1 Tax=Arundo donax TaxID=35708 RepID=A0A0A8YMP2_ARUDO
MPSSPSSEERLPPEPAPPDPATPHDSEAAGFTAELVVRRICEKGPRHPLRPLTVAAAMPRPPPAPPLEAAPEISSPRRSLHPGATPAARPPHLPEWKKGREAAETAAPLDLRRPPTAGRTSKSTARPASPLLQLSALCRPPRSPSTAGVRLRQHHHGHHRREAGVQRGARPWEEMGKGGAVVVGREGGSPPPRRGRPTRA